MFEEGDVGAGGGGVTFVTPPGGAREDVSLVSTSTSSTPPAITVLGSNVSDIKRLFLNACFINDDLSGRFDISFVKGMPLWCSEPFRAWIKVFEKALAVIYWLP